jgi:nucleoid DNA-binding protein
MLDKPSRSDMTTSSKRSSETAEAHGILAAVLQGLSAIYASAAKVTLEGFEDLADRRAERRAERLARGPERGTVTRSGSSRPVNARASTALSAPKRAPKSR